MAVEQNLAGEMREPVSGEPGARDKPALLGREGWEASLDLEFAARGARTILARRASVGPLVVQRPFYPEGGVAHVYLVHPPGGVVGGDRLQLNVVAKDGAHALLTTPAATKFYRSDGRVARQRQEITADAANVEWLPQETIVFPDARASIATCVRLGERARFIGWEVACYGRPASALPFGAGQVRQDFEVWVNGAPRVLDHLRLDGAGEAMRAGFGLAGHPVLGTMFAYPANDALLNAARAAMDDPRDTSGPSGEASRVAPLEPHGYVRGESLAASGSMADAPSGVLTSACSLVDGVLVCRAVGAQADAVRALFVRIWQQLRPSMMARAAVAPRIWAT
jgi:urease accessory protein